MTSQSPRIYIYKITFEEVLYYYYGVHKEKVFGEEYWGSPVTHKWCWDFYTPKKQILEIFPYTDDGWIEAQKVETRLIKPFYNTDKWCLNESCGGVISLEMYSNGGKIGGKIGGKKIYELGIAIFGLTQEEQNDRNSGGGKKAKELGVGVHGLTIEQMSENGKKGGKIGGKKSSSQKWECTETGYIANPGNLSKYQKRNGIDTSKRRRIS
jgi:hypothetical protein